MAHWPDVIRWPVHAIFLQEADINPTEIGKVKEDFVARDVPGEDGWQTHFGTVRASSNGAPIARVMSAIRQPAKMWIPTADETVLDLMDSGRWTDVRGAPMHGGKRRRLLCTFLRRVRSFQ